MNAANERSDSISTLCASYKDVNKKKIGIEDLKPCLKQYLLDDELEFKRNLYRIKIQTAQVDLDIKKEILSQIKG